MTSRLLMMAISLTIANYFCAAIGLTNWASAMDRSFFQSAALLYVWVALKFDRATLAPVSGGETTVNQMELMARDSDAEFARLTGIIFDLMKALAEAAERLEARGHNFGAREARAVLAAVGSASTPSAPDASTLARRLRG